MNNIKLIIAAAAVLAASSAFAQYDGQADNAWLTQPATTQLTPAPVPVPASSTDNRTSNPAPANVPAPKDERPAFTPYHGEYDHAW